MASSLPKAHESTLKEHKVLTAVYTSKNFEKRRRPQKRSSNIVWISPLSDFKEKVEEAKSSLLAAKIVFIGAVGPSIPHAINLAMVLQNFYPVSMETSTATVFQNDENRSGKKYPAPEIRIAVHLIETEKSPN